MNTKCTSAHTPKRARCEEMAAEIVALREQVATLTQQLDDERCTGDNEKLREMLDARDAELRIARSAARASAKALDDARAEVERLTKEREAGGLEHRLTHLPPTITHAAVGRAPPRLPPAIAIDARVLVVSARHVRAGETGVVVAGSGRRIEVRFPDGALWMIAAEMLSEVTTC